MKYELDRKTDVLRLTPETKAEREMLARMEGELDSVYGRSNYSLRFLASSKDHGNLDEIALLDFRVSNAIGDGTAQK